MNNAWSVVLVLASAILASMSQMMLKKSALREYGKWYQAYLNPLVISSYALLFCTTLINMQAYLWLPYKTVSIVATSSYIFVLSFSWLLFKEKITKRKLLGIALILFGIIIFILGS